MTLKTKKNIVRKTRILLITLCINASTGNVVILNPSPEQSVIPGVDVIVIE